MTFIGFTARPRWFVITPPLGRPSAKLPSVTTTWKSHDWLLAEAESVKDVAAELEPEKVPGQGVDQA